MCLPACAVQLADRDSRRSFLRKLGVVAGSAAVAPAMAWAEVAGMFGGKMEAGRVDDDASNPGSPKNGWLLRHGFGLLNVSYPGPKAITLEPGKPLVLKYKVTLMSGDAVKIPK